MTLIISMTLISQKKVTIYKIDKLSKLSPSLRYENFCDKIELTENLCFLFNASVSFQTLISKMWFRHNLWCKSWLNFVPTREGGRRKNKSWYPLNRGLLHKYIPSSNVLQSWLFSSHCSVLIIQVGNCGGETNIVIGEWSFWPKTKERAQNHFSSN